MVKAIVTSKIEWLNCGWVPLPEAEGGGVVPTNGYAINPWRGCQHGCDYCWARRLNRKDADEWRCVAVRDPYRGPTPDFTKLLPKLKAPWRLLLSASTDPFQDEPALREVMAGTLRGLADALGGHEREGEVWILTKNPLDGLDNHRKALHRFMPFFGVTITTLNTMASQQRELHAPAPLLRLEGLVIAHHALGFNTWVSIEPWWEATDPVEIIKATRDAGARTWVVGPENYRKGVAVDYRAGLERLRDHCISADIPWDVPDPRMGGIYLLRA